VQIPLRDFFRNSEKTSYTLSPNGEYFAYLAPYKNRMNVHVQKIGSKEKAVRLTGIEDRDLAGYFWATNDRILYARDFGGDENFHIFGVDINGENDVDLTPFDGVLAQMIDTLEDDDEHIIIGWVTDHDGKLRAAVATDGVNNSIMYRQTEKDEFKTVLTTNFRDSVNLLFFTFDNQHVFASSNLNRDKSAIVKFDPTTGKELEVIYEHPVVDVNNLSYSRKRKVLTSIQYVDWKRRFKFLDKERERLQNRLESQLGQFEIVVLNNSKAEDKFLIRTYSDRSLGAHYLYDKHTDKLEKIADVSPWLNENELSEMKPITYTSRDGLTISGYLTLPSTWRTLGA